MKAASHTARHKAAQSHVKKKCQRHKAVRRRAESPKSTRREQTESDVKSPQRRVTTPSDVRSPTGCRARSSSTPAADLCYRLGGCTAGFHCSTCDLSTVIHSYMQTLWKKSKRYYAFASSKVVSRSHRCALSAWSDSLCGPGSNVGLKSRVSAHADLLIAQLHQPGPTVDTLGFNIGSGPRERLSFQGRAWISGRTWNLCERKVTVQSTRVTAGTPHIFSGLHVCFLKSWF